MIDVQIGSQKRVFVACEQHSARQSGSLIDLGIANVEDLAGRDSESGNNAQDDFGVRFWELHIGCADHEIEILAQIVSVEELQSGNGPVGGKRCRKKGMCRFEEFDQAGFHAQIAVEGFEIDFLEIEKCAVEGLAIFPDEV